MDSLPTFHDLTLDSVAVVDTIYGPCPGCGNWTLETHGKTHPATVEQAMQEHARECPPLAELAGRYLTAIAVVPVARARWLIPDSAL